MKTLFSLRRLAFAIACLSLAAPLGAATTDLASSPLVTSAASSVLPNVFLMMDDSGSMDWDFGLDYPPGSAPFSTSKFGYASSQCNGVYYDPTITYTPPAKADGSSYANSSFSSAWMDGYNTGLGSINLGTTFNLSLSQSDSAPGSGVAAYYYKYSGTQTTEALKNFYNSSSTFYKECNTTAGSGPTATISVSSPSSAIITGITVNGTQIMSGSSASSSTSSTVAANIAAKITLAGYSATSSGSTVTITGPTAAGTYTPVITKTGTVTLTASAFAPFTKITVSSTSGPGNSDERQNFANWFSYYRTRLNMMKSGTGLAFKPIDNHYRVGFATMNNNGGSKFLNVGTFDSTQKAAWYAMLYSVTASNSTPLLKALSRAGQLYAHKLPSNTLNGVAATDPMQYSCQQNFTILSTDGFWNDATNYNLSGASVDNQDGSEPRPYNDGGSAVVTAKTPTSTVVRKQTVTPKTITKPWTRTIKFTAAGKGTGGCSSSKYLVTTQNQTYSQVSTTSTTSIDDTTSTTTQTIVTTNGAVTSNTTSAAVVSSANVSTVTTTTSDTGAPTGTTVWSNSGSPTYSCSSSPTPAAGTTSNGCACAGAAGTATGTAVTTTVSTTGPTVGTTTSTTTATGGTSNTLADVAMYYYKTDLRTSGQSNATGALGTDVSENNVPSSAQDSASWQHMTTFTLGLGARGRMVFSPTYLIDTGGDFASVKNGALAVPASGTCSWGTDGQICNWPTPDVAGTPENIDDLWHAAVNGRGAFFSADNPATLATGLSNALAGVSARLGAAAAATTSNPNVTTGDNFVFNSTFTTVGWDGELVRQQLDLDSGKILPAIDWSAQTQLDSNSSRTLYTADSATGNHLKTFAWGSLSAAEQDYFQGTNISTLSQFCTVGTTCLSAASQTAAGGANLVNFLRGDRSNEGPLADTGKYFRLRTHLLGDIVSAEAVYVKGSLYTYVDTGYTAFITANQSRTGMVYAAANDGMLHAFNSSTGTEAWAYIPSFVLPNLYKLADKNYANLHQYFVDGTPVTGDVYFGGAWHTIVVGGLNGGGRGYYAMDVTNPSSPSLLWEFSDTNLGYTYGNPVITKQADGTWVILVSSGYNNVSPGDGVGRLYVLNAGTGALIRAISTNAGSTTTPSGLAKINAWVDNGMYDNTALRVYGGDMLGNLWRFDINGNVGAAGYDAQLLATLKDSSGNAQPITTKPELGDVRTNSVVFVGTGRYLGVTDLANTSQQTFYAIKDSLGSGSYGNPRTSGGFVQQTMTTTTCPAGTSPDICALGETVRTSSSNDVNFATDNGWYIDLIDSGERANTDPALALGTILFNTSIPNTTACTVGGYGFRYFLDYASGKPVSTAAGIGGVKLGNALPTRGVPVRLPNNRIVALTRMSDGDTKSFLVPIGNAATAARRVSWRELVTDH